MTYNNSKAAMISFTKALANEVIPYGIRVNGVAPGSILHPTGNWQKRLEENPGKIKKFVEDEIPVGRFGRRGSRECRHVFGIGESVVGCRSYVER